MSTPAVGFIGLVNMGSAMAARLLGAGFGVTVYNRSPGKAEALAARGATVAATVAQACAGDVVITMLANDDALDAVVTGEGGVLATLRDGATHISSSTISAALSKQLTAAHGAAGQQFMTATVLGRPEAAAAGKLFVLAAGPTDVVDPLMPILDALGQRHPHHLDRVHDARHAGGLRRAAKHIGSILRVVDCGNDRRRLPGHSPAPHPLVEPPGAEVACAPGCHLGIQRMRLPVVPRAGR